MAITDSFRRVLEYLGLNDGEDEYDEIDERERERERPRQASPEDELERAYRERPNVRKIGPRRRSEDFEDIFAEDSPSCCMLPVTQWDHKSFIVIDAGSTFFEPRYCSNANGSSCKCTNPAGQAPGINPPGGGPSTFSGGTMLVGSVAVAADLSGK